MKSFATPSVSLLKRKYKESQISFLPDFQEDVHRILSSKAFRRLKGKTQVVMANTGDHYRDRLTHTIQVAQTAKIIASKLGLNIYLAEAIALAHDLGHTPFGHSGEFALDEVLKEYGSSFEHNKQSLKVVTHLETYFTSEKGLNLNYETLLGIDKHAFSHKKPNGQICSSSLEALLVNEADEITYIYHDLDDAFRSKLITIDDLKNGGFLELAQIEDFKDFQDAIHQIYIFLTKDLISNSNQLIEKYKIKTYEDVLNQSKPAVAFSKDALLYKVKIKKFLYSKYWTDSSISSQKVFGQKIIKNLFKFYYKSQDKLPNKCQLQIQKGESIIEVITDYIAGMTDQFAKEIYIKNALS